MADLGRDMPRDASTAQALARSPAGQLRQDGLLLPSLPARARTINHGARRAGDRTRPSAQVRPLLDLLHEAELLALLSSIGDVPVLQGLPVTGSVDPLGDVQAIGGVNEKIEGFFDLCAARGLNGRQGVVLPQAKVAQLMLRDDVVEAVAAGRFSLHALALVDDALVARPPCW